MTSAHDHAIDALAARQLGVVTRAQLLEHGIPANAIDSRVKSKRLRLLHRGVYRVGPLVVPHARELAAVFACGPHAVLSHRSAARLWQFLPAAGDAAPVEISTSRGDPRRGPDIHLHRVSLAAEDVTTLDSIPMTSVARTLLDLAAILPGRGLERVLARAERLELLQRRDLLSLLKRNAGRRGAPLLHTLLYRDGGPALTRSEAEQRFLTLIRKGQLPAPETNVRVCSYEVDFYWPHERLVVEVDGFVFHSSQRKFENDRRRDATLMATGIRVVRVTWHQVVNEPEATLVRVAQTLGRID